MYSQNLLVPLVFQEVLVVPELQYLRGVHLVQGVPELRCCPGVEESVQ